MRPSPILRPPVLRSGRVAIVLCAFALLCSACRGSIERNAHGGAGSGGGGAGGGEPPARVEFGLASRPTNTTCIAFERPQVGTLDITVSPSVFANLTANDLSPLVAAVQAPGVNSEWYTVKQTGVIYTFANNASVNSSRVFLDITSGIESDGEKGLLGLAFHPNYAQNGYAYLNYTRRTGGQLRTRIVRYTRQMTANGPVLDPASEQLLIEVDQPYDNHNGGTLAFGPDGYLYLGLGDGGSGGDPQNRAQNLDVILGKVLRIDVDNAQDGKNYGIPSTNPFAASGGAKEIYAWGFRNPWKISFDQATGVLWAGDVGQDTTEEVDIVQLGGNYGWRDCEGSTVAGGSTTPCSASYVAPVAEYDHSEGQSITSGFVYRGSELPELVGSFIYGDFVSGRMWRAFESDTAGKYTSEELDSTGRSIASFAQDQNGEVYVLDYGGTFHKLVRRTGGPPSATLPAQLSATGCVDAADVTRPASGLIPYGVNVPFWSDGAEKERFLALPEGATIAIGSDGDWDLPAGSVLVKNFRLAGRLFETRLMMRHPDGIWGGYTYVWNAEQSEATLIYGSQVKQVASQSWHFPSRGECLQCHNSASAGSLGLRTEQLNGDFVYPGNLVADQLRTLEHIGVLSAPLPSAPTELPRLEASTSMAALDVRARSYLDSNCAYCHRPGGPGGGAMDLRFATPLASTQTCNAMPQVGDLGIANARLIAPGDPARSLIVQRAARTGLGRMPPVGSLRVDDDGVALLTAWVTSLQSCP